VTGVFSNLPGWYPSATEAISVVVARLGDPCPEEPYPQQLAAPGTPRAASPPNRDYF